MSLFGLRHTLNTKVGNNVVRGVSGGERKRVSIAELMTTGAKIACHDNSTPGLDASTALRVHPRAENRDRRRQLDHAPVNLSVR